ncbi:MAG: hypothetical protein GWP10_07490 [Nitrospiraceae bacterium]|nr:hypothetical protein [Nitrospiraceae bacterium]
MFGLVKEEAVIGKRLLFISVLLLVVGGFAVVALGGEVFMNASGATANAFYITFSEPVRITRFGGVFMTHAPLGLATEFVSGGGQAQQGDSFWLSWEPDLAIVLEHRWLLDGSDIEANDADKASPNNMHANNGTNGAENRVDIVDRVITERGIDKYSLRKDSIDYEDLPLLGVFFRDSTLDFQFRRHFPITTWQDLFNALSSSGGPSCPDSKPLILRLLFDLGGEWPWECPSSGGLLAMPNASTSYKTVDSELGARGFDAHSIRKARISIEDRPLLSLFFSDTALGKLASAFPITRWQTLRNIGISVCSRSQAILLRFLFNLDGAWPWAPSTDYTPLTPPSLDVHWKFEWRSSETTGCTAKVEVTIENKGFTTSKDTVCWVGLNDIGTWYYDVDESRAVDIRPGEKWRFTFNLFCPYRVWTRLDINVSNDTGTPFSDKSRQFFAR